MATIGQGIEITFEEDVYHVSPMGPGVRSNFALWFKSRAIKKLDESRKLVDLSRWTRWENSLRADIELDKYEWGGEFHRQISDDQLVVIGETLARLRIRHPDTSEEFVRRMAETMGWDKLYIRVNLADGPLPNVDPPSTETKAGESAEKA